MPDRLMPSTQSGARFTVVDIDGMRDAWSGHEPRIAELEHELGAMRAELAETACRSERSGDEQKMLNEALAAHNSQLQETLALLQGLLASLERGAGQAADSGKLLAWRTNAARAVHGLTTRQREVMALVIAGHPSKNIAAGLGISQRTVENHRAAIMGRTGCKSLPALAWLALAAAWTGSDHSLVLTGPVEPGER